MRESRPSQFGLKQARRDHARHVLTNCGVPVGADFHTLPAAKVDSLLEWAARDRYRKPKNASGSRGRHYHAKLQREAAYVL